MNIEGVRIDESGIVAITRRVEQFEVCSARNPDATNLDVFERCAEKSLYWRVEAQGLLDRILFQPAVLKNGIKLIGVVHQKKHHAADQIGRGLVAADE